MSSQAYKNNGTIVIWNDETEGGEEQAPGAAFQAAVEAMESVQEWDEQRFQKWPAHRGESDDTLAACLRVVPAPRHFVR